MVGKWKKVGNFGEVCEGGGRKRLDKKSKGKRRREREAEIGDGYVLAGNMRTVNFWQAWEKGSNGTP